MYLSAFAFLLWSNSAGAPPDQTLRVTSAKIEAISASRQLTPREKSTAITRAYLAEIKPLQSRAPSLSDSDVHTLFNVADVAFFYSLRFGFDRREQFLEDMISDVTELEKRGILEKDETASLYQGMLALRRFSGAAKLAQKHPEAALPPAPQTVSTSDFDPRATSVYALDGDGQSLRLHNIDTHKKHLVVIVAQCHFARDAAAGIAKDPALKEALSKANVIWLESSTQPLDTDDLRAWNAQFPDQPLSIAYDNKQWPDVDFSSSPGFFFFEDGKLISQDDGWSDTETITMITKSLQRMGLLTCDICSRETLQRLR